MLNSSGTATEYVLIHIISLSFESENLHKFFPVSFHAATDEGTPQKFSPQDTPTKSSLNFFYGSLSCLNSEPLCLRW